MINIKLQSNSSSSLARLAEVVSTKEKLEIEIVYKIKVKGKKVAQGVYTGTGFTKNTMQERDIKYTDVKEPGDKAYCAGIGPTRASIELDLLAGEKKC